MTYTTDTLTGKRFRYTESTRYMGLVVPCRYTTSRCVVLAPSRVPLPLLQQLNPDVRLDSRSDVLTIEQQSGRGRVVPMDRNVKAECDRLKLDYLVWNEEAGGMVPRKVQQLTAPLSAAGGAAPTSQTTTSTTWQYA